MIYADFKDWDRDRIGLSPKLEAVLAWLREAPLEQWADGSYPLPLWSEEALLIIKTAALEPERDVLFERHERHLDIHYCIAGEEEIGYARDDGKQEAVSVARPMEDHFFYKPVEGALRLLLKPGTFALFFPGELHQPCCATPSALQVRKVVVKLPG